VTADVRNGPGRPVRVGDSFDQVLRVLGVELESEWRVVELDPPTLLRFEGTATAGARAASSSDCNPMATAPEWSSRSTTTSRLATSARRSIRRTCTARTNSRRRRSWPDSSSCARRRPEQPVSGRPTAAPAPTCRASTLAPPHGAEMEGWFLRLTDPVNDRVVVALCGINRHAAGDWATVAVAAHG
jgi:hypothetical protein